MNKTKFANRGPNINTDSCVEQIGNRFDLVLVASERAREIRRQNRESHAHEHLHANVTALEEIQAGKVGREYLKKLK